MSQAIRTNTRGRVKSYRFSPGRLERAHLDVWRVPGAGGLIRVRIWGQAYVACGAGNEHYPQLEGELVNHPDNDDAGDFKLALAGNEDAATRLAEELEAAILEDWFDPCEAEGLDEEDVST